MILILPNTFFDMHSNWKWPQIPGLQDFKGELIHSANWPEKYEYSGKKVAVIGNGSSGVQIVPALQPGNNLTIPSTNQY
jgi:cation diffusion facilitator CzcD-associated flavoprotein CzcO